MANHKGVAPVCWRREWDGDVSDLGQYVHVDDPDERDSYTQWEALYSEADVLPLIEALQQAKLQIEYLHGKFRHTGSGGAVLLYIERALKGQHGS